MLYLLNEKENITFPLHKKICGFILFFLGEKSKECSF